MKMLNYKVDTAVWLPGVFLLASKMQPVHLLLHIARQLCLL